MTIAAPQIGSDRARQASLQFLHALLDDLQPREFAIRLWDGTTLEADAGRAARFTVVLKHPGALRAMFLSPSELSLGEAYIYDDFDVEGDIEGIFPAVNALLGDLRLGVVAKLRQARHLLALPATRRPRLGRQPAKLEGRVHSLERDRQAVRYHYDRSNDFFQLFLDRRMVYTCAYFRRPDEDLDTAQERKLDYVCRKLRLRPGERLLDIGCGWGGLVIHAAQRYGVDATGVTLSEEQARLAGERIRSAGLQARCRVELRDYREVEAAGGFDKATSIEMFEAVGEARLAEYFGQVHRLLRPGGVFLNQGISCSIEQPPQTGPSFTSQYVFPDGELSPISTVARLAEGAGFEVRDLESLREHYPLTLRRWVANLEARCDAARRLTDEVTYRIWRLYMAGSAHSFASGWLRLYHLLLVKPSGAGVSGLPLGRGDWYAPAG